MKIRFLGSGTAGCKIKKKNTKEFAAFGQTIFFREQYTEQVRFDRFQIRVRED